MSVSPARLLLRDLPSLAGPLPDFDPAAASDTPQEQFLAWLRDAIAAGIREPHAMTLSTMDQDRPDARVLILKDLDEHGWHFATSLLSPKGQQIAAVAQVALTFYWPVLGRQVRIRGTASDLGRDAAAADFRARSPGAQANAALERQSLILDRQAERDSVAPLAVPPNWRVFAVDPFAVEFWQGRPDRRHIRLRYEPSGLHWKTTQLWP